MSKRRRRWLVSPPSDTADTPTPASPDSKPEVDGAALFARPRPPATEDRRTSGEPLVEDPQGTDAQLDVGPEGDTTHAVSGPPIRWLLLGLLILLGGFALAVPERDCAGFASTTDAAPAIVGAAAATAFWVAVIATIVYVVRRVRRRPRSWPNALVSTSTLSISLVFLVLSAVGLAVQRSDDCGFTESATPSRHAKTTSGQPLTAAQRSVVTYINGFIRCTEGATSGRRVEARFLAALKKGQFTRAASNAATQQRTMRTYGACLRGIVALDDQALVGPAQRSADSITDIARAWRDYERGAEQQSVALLKRGDRRINRATRQARRAATDAEAVYNARGGADLANQINFERLLKARERAGLS
jgi:hypothetical protein